MRRFHYQTYGPVDGEEHLDLQARSRGEMPRTTSLQS